MKSAVIVLVAIAGPLFIAPPSSQGTQGASATADEIQSTYLRSFADFIEWSSPERVASKTVNFCILGRDPYGALLDKSVLGHPVGDRRTIITRAQHFEDLGNTCNVLFISSSETKHEAKILERLRNKDVLTVGATDDFAARGGIIQFVMNQGRVGFLINVDAAQRAGLRIGASLLALAKIVHDEPGKSGG